LESAGGCPHKNNKTARSAPARGHGASTTAGSTTAGNAAALGVARTRTTSATARSAWPGLSPAGTIVSGQAARSAAPASSAGTSSKSNHMHANMTTTRVRTPCVPIVPAAARASQACFKEVEPDTPACVRRRARTPDPPVSSVRRGAANASPIVSATTTCKNTVVWACWLCGYPWAGLTL